MDFPAWMSKKCKSWTSTLWKFQDFSLTHIVREIKVNILKVQKLPFKYVTFRLPNQSEILHCDLRNVMQIVSKKIPIFREIDDQEGLKIIIWKADSKLRHLRARGLVNINQYLTKNLWTLFHQANMRPGKLATAFPTLRSCLTENDRLTLTDLDKKYREIRSQLWRGWKMHNIWLICFKTFVKRTCVC